MQCISSDRSVRTDRMSGIATQIISSFACGSNFLIRVCNLLKIKSFFTNSDSDPADADKTLKRSSGSRRVAAGAGSESGLQVTNTINNTQYTILSSHFWIKCHRCFFIFAADLALPSRPIHPHPHRQTLLQLLSGGRKQEDEPCRARSSSCPQLTANTIDCESVPKVRICSKTGAGDILSDRDIWTEYSVNTTRKYSQPRKECAICLNEKLERCCFPTKLLNTLSGKLSAEKLFSYDVLPDGRIVLQEAGGRVTSVWSTRGRTWTLDTGQWTRHKQC